MTGDRRWPVSTGLDAIMLLGVLKG